MYLLNLKIVLLNHPILCVLRGFYDQTDVMTCFLRICLLGEYVGLIYVILEFKEYNLKKVFIEKSKIRLHVAIGANQLVGPMPFP